MKIDNNRANFDRLEKARTEAASAEAAAKKDGGKVAQPGSDSVRISSGVQFASSAVNAASTAPEIRLDKVERAKAMLNDGTLGSDPFKLADAIIDRAISKE